MSRVMDRAVNRIIEAINAVTDYWYTRRYCSTVVRIQDLEAFEPTDADIQEAK